MLDGQVALANAQGTQVGQAPLPAPQVPGTPPMPPQLQPKVSVGLGPITVDKNATVEVGAPSKVEDGYEYSAEEGGDWSKVGIGKVKIEEDTAPASTVTAGQMTMRKNEKPAAKKIEEMLSAAKARRAPEGGKNSPGGRPEYISLQDAVKRVGGLQNLEKVYPGVTSPNGYLAHGRIENGKMLLRHPDAIMEARAKAKAEEKK